MKVYCYTRKEIAEILWISEQRVSKSKKVLKIYIRNRRNQSGYMIRYILYSDIENEKRNKGETW